MRTLLLMMAALSLFSFDANARQTQGNEAEPELRIECVMPDDVFYEGQPVPVTVTLKSTTPDIAFARPVEEPRLNKSEFATFQTISPAGNAYEEKTDGQIWYCFPLRANMVTLSEKGKYEYGGGSYLVGVNRPVVVNDPFWGRVRTKQTDEYTVKVGKKGFKVKSVPAPPSNINYSGSVGTFTLETVVPKGNIYLNEEATAYIILRGTGMIAESTLPEYRDAFIKGVKLKSVSEQRDEGHDRGKIMSEITLECTFIPTDIEEAEIGEARFDFFNPKTGKYETIKTKPVKVNVKSTATKRESMSI